MERTTKTCAILCGLAFAAAACSSPDVPLGRGGSNVGANNKAGTGGASTEVKTTPVASSTPTEATGACDAPDEILSTDDAWWQAKWTSASPELPESPIMFIQPPNMYVLPGTFAPAAVGRWVAPHDGEYFVRAWSEDTNVVSLFAKACGDALNAAGGYMDPDVLPDVPWQLSTGPQPSGVISTGPIKAGDELFFWAQYLDASSAPDQGSAVINIGTVAP